MTNLVFIKKWAIVHIMSITAASVKLTEMFSIALFAISSRGESLRLVREINSLGGIMAAEKKNSTESGESYELTAIEPYPPRFLKDSSSIGISNLIQKELQDVNTDVLATLDRNDILFLDSTHVVSINSDVCWEFLEILPRLQKGVIIHVHDIFLPYEYPRAWVKDKKTFWNEAYLLQAFLMYNNAFEVIWAGNWMKTRYPDDFRRTFRSNASQSFWIRKIA